MSIGLLQSVFCRHWFCQQVIEIWNDEATLKQWISVELALAKAQSKVGLIPAAAYQIIVDKARPECIDLQRMQKDIAHAMHPFVPLLHQLEELCGDEAAGYLHWGATTQNIFDTAQALQLKDSHRLLIDYIDRKSVV